MRPLRKSSRGSDANTTIFGHVTDCWRTANFIKLTLVVVSRDKIFLVKLFCAPTPAAPGGNCLSLSYATAR